MKRTLFALWLVLTIAVTVAADVSSSQARKYGKQLEALIRGQRAFSLGEFIKDMGELDDSKVVRYIPPAAVAMPSADNSEAAMEAIGGLKNEKSVQALVTHLKSRRGDFREAVVILGGFARREDPASLDAIIAQLSSKVPLVQVAAIRACRERKSGKSIAELVDVLSKHFKTRDRILLEARMTLLVLTGQDFEDIADWKKYVSTLPKDFDPNTVGKASGPTGVSVKTTKDSVRFFGGEIFSYNVIFVIDVSGSMAMYDDSDEYEGADVEADRERLRRARDQLSLALKSLPRKARFNLITFSDKVLTWQKQMQYASRGTVGSALKFVGEFKARGATHTDEALEKALEDVTVDTIVLLSDGAPMKAQQRQPGPLIEKIVKRVKDLNATRRVRVDTFGFEGEGEWPSNPPGGFGRTPPPATPEERKMFVDFLKQLAEESGGKYRAVH